MPEQVFVAQPIGFGKAQILATPFQFEFTGEDRLRVQVSASVTTQVGVTLRFVTRAGTIDVARHVFVVVGDRTVQTFDIPMGHGFVSNVVARAFSTTVQPGQCYIVVLVARGSNVGGLTVIGQMLGGYATLNAPLSWPGSPIIASTEGHGAALTLEFGPFATGSEISVTVPDNTRWAPLILQSAMLTGAGGGALLRTPTLQFMRGIVSILRVPMPIEQPGSTLQIYSWGRGLASFTPPGTVLGVTAPMPQEVALPAGTLIITNTWNFDATDTWGNANLTVQEWLSV